MTSNDQTPKADPVWRKPDGSPISCVEKIKVLNQNYEEIRQIAQDALDDAILMGCSEKQVKDAFRRLLEGLESPFSESEKETD